MKEFESRIVYRMFPGSIKNGNFPVSFHSESDTIFKQLFKDYCIQLYLNSLLRRNHAENMTSQINILLWIF